MSYFAKDGADVSATDVVRYDCSVCGSFETTRYPRNEREKRETILAHINAKHGGTGR